MTIHDAPEWGVVYVVFLCSWHSQRCWNTSIFYWCWFTALVILAFLLIFDSDAVSDNWTAENKSLQLTYTTSDGTDSTTEHLLIEIELSFQWLLLIRSCSAMDMQEQPVSSSTQSESQLQLLRLWWLLMWWLHNITPAWCSKLLFLVPHFSGSCAHMVLLNILNNFSLSSVWGVKKKCSSSVLYPHLSPNNNLLPVPS